MAGVSATLVWATPALKHAAHLTKNLGSRIALTGSARMRYVFFASSNGMLSPVTASRASAMCAELYPMLSSKKILISDVSDGSRSRSFPARGCSLRLFQRW